jgi:polysaccharide chain length determinant protein (PEP-CTERM system associated)
VTVGVVYMMPTIYSAEAVVLVESQRIPESYVAATVNATLQDRINALKQQILSYGRLAQIVQKYNLYGHTGKPVSMEDRVDLMRQDLKIDLERGIVPGRPGAFRVGYQGPNATVVAEVANSIANLFVEENLRTREVEAAGTADFLNSQLNEAKKRLEEQESQMSAYKLQYNGELPQQENALIASISQLRVQLTGVQDNINRVQQNRAMLEATMQGAETSLATLTNLGPQQAPEAARDGQAAPQLAGQAVPAPPRESERLEQQLEALRVRYNDRHPDVQRTLRLLTAAREAEAREPRAPAAAAASDGPAAPAPSPAALPGLTLQARTAIASVTERIQSLKAQIPMADHELENLRREREGLLRQIADTEARIRNLPVREQQLAAVTRDYEITNLNYRSLLDKKLAADVASDMERRQKSERFVIVDMARTPERPIKPKRLILNAGGSIFGLALGLLLAFGIEFRRNAVLGEWELPAGVPVLGRVPLIKPMPAAATGRLARASAVFLAVLAHGGGIYIAGSGW